LILDVGCGDKQIGEVNCDIEIKKPSRKHLIQCDAQKLPLRSNLFTVVHSCHTLEHIPEPLKALEEMNRVSKAIIYLVIPNLHIIKEYPKHLYVWGETSLSNLLNLKFQEYTVYVNSRLDPLFKHPIYGYLMRLSYFSIIFRRLAYKLTKMELVAICKKSSIKSKTKRYV